MANFRGKLVKEHEVLPEEVTGITHPLPGGSWGGVFSLAGAHPLEPGPYRLFLSDGQERDILINYAEASGSLTTVYFEGKGPPL